MTPLMIGSWKGHMKVVDFLLRNGAQIGEMDQNGKTALHWAVEYGHYEIMLRLLVV